MPGCPKRFIAISISIVAMAMSTFNTVRITQLNEEINTLKEKTDFILHVVHLHEKHLHHLEEKLDQKNKLLTDLLESNIWFSSKATGAIEKKFQSVVHHHENIVKSAQHHRLAPGALPHDVLDGIIDHVTHIAKKRKVVPFDKFASDLFQIEVSHVYTPATNKFTLILHIPIVSKQICSTYMNSCCSRSTSTLPPTFQSLWMSDEQISSQLDTPNPSKQFPAQNYMLVCTSETPSFAKG
jgi:hypothetical protein